MLSSLKVHLAVIGLDNDNFSIMNKRILAYAVIILSVVYFYSSEASAYSKDGHIHLECYSSPKERLITRINLDTTNQIADVTTVFMSKDGHKAPFSEGIGLKVLSTPTSYKIIFNVDTQTVNTYQLNRKSLKLSMYQERVNSVRTSTIISECSTVEIAENKI